MLRQSHDELTDVGDWYFIKEDTYIVFKYGKGWQDIAVIPISRFKRKECWQWNGSKEAPIITPSAKVLGAPGEPDIWHGYLTDGKLTNA